MAIPGSYQSVQYPRWLLATAGLTLVLLGAGVTIGAKYMTSISRMEKVELDHLRLSATVDTLKVLVDSIIVGSVEPARLLRSLATLRCLDGTSLQLLNAAGVPCAQLITAAPLREGAHE
jgi:hypothetical protein